LKDVLISLINAETSQRGFIITGNQIYLEPYNSAIADLDAKLSSLHLLFSDNATREQRINQSLIPLIEKRLILLNSSITARQRVGFSAASDIIVSGEGKIVMDEIRKNIASMIDLQENLLKSRTTLSITKQQNLLSTTLVGILISSIVTGITLLVTYSRLRLNFTQINDLLDSKVKMRTQELALAITQLETANTNLKRQGELQKEFVNVAAHELRTPTQSIMGYAEILLHSPERNVKYENTIYRNAERLNSLAKDILDVARIESETLKINKSKFDITEEIENAIKDITTKPDWRQVNKKVDLIFEPKESITVFADKERVYQVIQNLVTNALKFTEQGSIIIRAEKNMRTNDAVISVTDTGKGIDKEILPRLFLKFASKSDSGTGLGLFISKAMIEAQGGTIEGYNNIGSPGASFRFTIPITEPK
jgi:signal transduction histidine kinase